MFERIFLTNLRGEKLAAIFHIPNSCIVNEFVVILCHGMFSSKDGVKQIAISNALEEAGIPSIRFDFSGCGESGGKIEEVSISRRLQDLEAVVQFVKTKGLKRVALIGSSLGAVVALLATSGGIVKESEFLILIATPSGAEILLEQFSEDKVSRWKNTGFLEVDGKKIGWQFVEDFSMYNVLSEAKKIKCPTLLIHGSRDEVVPVKSSMEILDAMECPKKLIIIDNGNHLLSKGEEIKEINKLILEWFEHGKNI